MKNMAYHCILVLFIFSSSHLFSDSHSHKADIIIFSYDRPLQLYALLESSETYIQGIENSYIIYRTSSARYQQAYEQVKKSFQHTIFIPQDPSNIAQSFRKIVLDTINKSPSHFVLFAVDDNIVTDYIDLAECIEALNHSRAYSFHLRLGENITYCYALNQKSPVPPLTPIAKNIFQWTFKHGIGDWGYPNNVDMSLYRKTDLAVLRTFDFVNPNTLEAFWACYTGPLFDRYGLCFQHSKIINIPLNLVNMSANRHMNAISPCQLLELFEKGMKIDIAPLHNISNNSCHTEYMPQFVQR